MTLGLAGDGLAVGDARLTGLNLKIELIAHPVQDHSQVQLAHTAQHGLVGLGIEFQAQAGILGGELGQGIGEFLLVAPARQFQHHAVHRRRQWRGLELQHVVGVHGVEHASVIQLVDLGQRGDTAGTHRLHFLGLGALQGVQVRHLDGLALIVQV